MPDDQGALASQQWDLRVFEDCVTVASTLTVMYRTKSAFDPTQGCEPSSIGERAPEQGPVARQISRKTSGVASDGLANPSEEDQDAAGREGLFGKLQSRISLSLSRLGSIEPTQNPFKRRRSSLESNQSAAALAENADSYNAEKSSPALNALMPFVPLMFRRDLLLPKPTFSAMQVQCFLKFYHATRVRPSNTATCGFPCMLFSMQATCTPCLAWLRMHAHIPEQD